MSIDSLFNMLFTLSVLIFLIASQREIKEIKSQNNMLKDILLTLIDSAKNQTSNTQEKAKGEKDGNRD